MHGALAQLGARHTGSVEVTGSNPVCSIFLCLKFYFGNCIILGNSLKACKKPREFSLNVIIFIAMIIKPGNEGFLFIDKPERCML